MLSLLFFVSLLEMLTSFRTKLAVFLFQFPVFPLYRLAPAASTMTTPPAAAASYRLAREHVLGSLCACDCSVLDTVSTVRTVATNLQSVLHDALKL